MESAKGRIRQDKAGDSEKKVNKGSAPVSKNSHDGSRHTQRKMRVCGIKTGEADRRTSA